MASDVILGAILNHPVVETLPPEVIFSAHDIPKYLTDSAYFQPSIKARAIEI